MDVKIQQQWKEKLQGEFDKEYFKNLVSFLHAERLQGKQSTLQAARSSMHLNSPLSIM